MSSPTDAYEDLVDAIRAKENPFLFEISNEEAAEMVRAHVDAECKPLRDALEKIERVYPDDPRMTTDYREALSAACHIAHEALAGGKE